MSETKCGPGEQRCSGGYDGLDEPIPCDNHYREVYSMIAPKPPEWSNESIDALYDSFDQALTVDKARMKYQNREDVNRAFARAVAAALLRAGIEHHPSCEWCKESAAQADALEAEK